MPLSEASFVLVYWTACLLITTGFIALGWYLAWVLVLRRQAFIREVFFDDAGAVVSTKDRTA
jgi:hypothetical protein